MVPATLALLIVLPLGLVLWLWLWPPGSLLGVAVQGAASALVLVALGLVAVWVLPPLWMRWVYAGALAAAAFRALRPRPGRPLWPRGWERLDAAVFVLIGLAAAGVVAEAWRGRTPPAPVAIDLAPPLGPGRAIAASAGASPLLNGHLKTLSPEHAAYLGQSFAVDFLGLGPLGFRAEGLRPEDPAAYAIWDRPVLAPCDGRVVAARDGLPDLPVPRTDPENKAGNHVLLACGAVHVLLAHLRQGSVAVAPGERVSTGRQVGRVGNSGNTTEPHLHVHVQTPGTEAAPLSGAPLPFTVAGRYLVRNAVLEP